MMALTCRLGPRCLAADSLVALAKQRLTGLCRLRSRQMTAQIWLSQGRPWQLQRQDQEPTLFAQQIRQDLSQIALWHMGEGSFQQLPATEAKDSYSTIDPLQCMLQALLQQLESVQIEAAIAARANVQITAAPFYERLNQAFATYGSQGIAAPAHPMRLSHWLEIVGADKERMVLCHVIMGGVTQQPESNVWQQVVLPAEQEPLPAATSVSSVLAELEHLYEQRDSLNDYQWLAVERSCAPEQLRSAYFAKAKQWHQDKLVGEHLTSEQLAKAQVLFEHMEQAYQRLSDPEERKNYDWVLERQARGLPIDAQIMLKADELFHKAARLVRNGQSAAALPLLREAVALNKGEANYWAYLGFAIYGQQGSQGLAEAWSCLDTAAGIAEQSVIYEFRGKIVAGESKPQEAVGWLEQAIACDANNKEAEQYLRLLRGKMQTQGQAQEKVGLLSRMLGHTSHKPSDK